MIPSPAQIKINIVAGIFISHSLLDRPFVSRLTTDLVDRGFPVWSDRWEIPGIDPLPEKIAASPGEDFFLLVILSAHSVGSEWMSMELHTALIKEQETGRQFIIPIRIDDCCIPETLQGRTCVDLSNGSGHDMNILDQELRKWHVDKIELPLSNMLIALNFLMYSEVDAHAVENAYRYMKVLGSQPTKVDETQVIVTEEPLYRQLKERLFYRITHFDDDPYNTPEIYQQMVIEAETLTSYERQLKKGVCDILNHYGHASIYYLLPETIFWFCRLMRSRIMYILWITQMPERYNPDIVEIDRQLVAQWHSSGLIVGRAAASFFEIKQACQLSMGGHFSFWMDAESPSVTELGVDGLPACDAITVGEISKYLIPQMLAFVEPEKQIWTMKDTVIRRL
jgi:hypothetical protein